MLEEVREQAASMLDRGHSHSKSLGGSGTVRRPGCGRSTKSILRDQTRGGKALGGGGAVTRGFAGRRVDSAHPD